jgi:CheY-like chemotaxis protein
MKHRDKILWVEDGALFDLAYLAGPVYMDGQYELTVAQNITEAIEFLQNGEFQAVIIDIRLPPGEDQQWNEIYKMAGRQKSVAHLGLKLLRSILGNKDAEIKLEKCPSWLTPDKVGVFTVETYGELRVALEELGIQVFQQKKANLPKTVLYDLIKRIC